MNTKIPRRDFLKVAPAAAGMVAAVAQGHSPAHASYRIRNCLAN
jgi:hypothetical protein